MRYANKVLDGVSISQVSYPGSTSTPQLSQLHQEVLNGVPLPQGPSHMEIMLCADGPCLVEVGSRCQGGEGSWIVVADECIGFSQVTATVDLYTTGQLFESLQEHTYPMVKFGREVDLVSLNSGVVRAMPGEKVILL